MNIVDKALNEEQAASEREHMWMSLNEKYALTGFIIET